MIRFKRLPHLAITAVVFLLLAMLIISPEKCMNYVLQGLILFGTKVFPASFPFFFCTQILSAMGIGEDIGRLIGKPIGKLYNTNECSGYILTMSLLCGYPIGAALTAECVQYGRCTREEANAIIAFTSTSGPLFVFGTIGSGMLNNSIAAVVILLSHYLSAFINGFIFRRSENNKTQISVAKNNILEAQKQDISIFTTIGKAVEGSTKAILVVGGYIVIFNLVAGMMYEVGMVGAIASFAALIGVAPTICEGLFVGLIEVTKGCAVLSSGVGSAGVWKVVPIIAAIVSFGGASIILQSISFLQNAGISPKRLLVTKISQGIIAYVIAYLFCLFV